MTPTTDPARPTVAVVGLGAMGSRLAANLLADGYPVIAWNRSPGPLESLAGAAVASSPAKAAAGADVVIVTVTDDAASRETWTRTGDGVLDGLRPGSVGIEYSTISPEWAVALAGAASAAGARVLESPMIGTRPQVEARQLVHLVSGDVAVLESVRDVLAVSAARIEHCGAPGAAATLKLAVNAMLATQVVAVAELLGVTARAGLAVGSTMELLAGLPVTGPAVARAGGAMVRGAFSPNFPVDLVAKDLRYLTGLGAGVGAALPMAAAALGAFEAASAAGHGGDDLTGVARTFLPQRPVAG